MPKGWEKLGEGTYNRAYRKGNLVLKIPKDASDQTDTPERSVRLWNLINSHLPTPAKIEETEEGIGWVCPYVEGRQANDVEMCGALINIFNKTGRIVVDAVAEKNFVTTKDNQVVCVDIGMAVELAKEEDENLAQLARRGSIVGRNMWETTDFSRFFNHCTRLGRAQTVETIKALVFIKEYRPDIANADFLKENPTLRTKLAKAYDSGSAPKELMSELAEVKPHLMESVTNGCLTALQRYIDSRGSINAKGEFQPSQITKIFRDATLTERKIKEVQDLMNDIKDADSPVDIQIAINNFIEHAKMDETLFASRGTSGLETALGACRAIVSAAERDPEFQVRQQAMPSDGM